MVFLRPLVEMQVTHPSWGPFATKVLQWGINPRNGSKSDQAHPPIHPTKLASSKVIFYVLIYILNKLFLR